MCKHINFIPLVICTNNLWSLRRGNVYWQIFRGKRTSPSGSNWEQFVQINSRTTKLSVPLSKRRWKPNGEVGILEILTRHEDKRAPERHFARRTIAVTIMRVVLSLGTPTYGILATPETAIKWALTR